MNPKITPEIETALQQQPVGPIRLDGEPGNAFDQDTVLVIAEAAIDALSYAALRCDLELTRFVSIGGQLNPEQPMLIQSAIENLPSGHCR